MATQNSGTGAPLLGMAQSRNYFYLERLTILYGKRQFARITDGIIGFSQLRKLYKGKAVIRIRQRIVIDLRNANSSFDQIVLAADVIVSDQQQNVVTGFDGDTHRDL